MKRLREEKAVRKVYRHGKRKTSNYLTLLYLENKCLQVNYAIHVRKKFGIAVRRNRIKRVFRELLLRFKEILSGYDIIILPRKKADELEFSQLYQCLEEIFFEAAILNQK